MTPLVERIEATTPVDRTKVGALAEAIVAATLDPSDEHAYAAALDAFVASTPGTLWLVELLVEAEMYANGRPVREPCGIRRTAWQDAP